MICGNSADVRANVGGVDDHRPSCCKEEDEMLDWLQKYPIRIPGIILREKVAVVEDSL